MPGKATTAGFTCTVVSYEQALSRWSQYKCATSALSTMTQCDSTTIDQHARPLPAQDHSEGPPSIPLPAAPLTQAHIHRCRRRAVLAPDPSSLTSNLTPPYHRPAAYAGEDLAPASAAALVSPPPPVAESDEAQPPDETKDPLAKTAAQTPATSWN